MAFPIQTIEFDPKWLGFYNRRQLNAQSEYYASMLHNAEVRGGVLRKRGGTQLLNGASGYLTNPAVAATTLVMNQTHGFRTGDVVDVMRPDGTSTTRTVTFAFPASLLLTISTTLDAPIGTMVTVVRHATSNEEFVSGLFQARFQQFVPSPILALLRTSVADNLEVRYAGVGGRELRPLNATLGFPSTTVLANWASNSIGTIVNCQGIRVGDRITINNQVTEIVALTPSTQTIEVSPVLSANPTAGTAVWFFPRQAYGEQTDTLPLKLSGAVMENRAIMTTIENRPTRVAPGHVAQASAGWSTTTGAFIGTLLSKNGVSWNTVGLDVMFEIDDGDGGQLFYRRVTSATGTPTAGTLVINPALPIAPPAGTRITQLRHTRVGIGAPLTPVQVLSGAAGVLTGTYLYRYKFERFDGSDAESEPSPVSAPVILAATQANISQIPTSPDPTVTRVSIWRTFANATAIFYRVGAVNNGTNVTTDNVPDTALVTAMREFLDDPPDDRMGIVVPWPHAQRLMGITFNTPVDRSRQASPNSAPPTGVLTARVVWSEGPDLLRGQLKPEAWPLDNFLFIGLDSDDHPVGIAPFFDSMLIFCHRSIWRIEGIPPDLTVEPVNFRYDGTGLGVRHHQQLAVDQNDCIFPGPDGVYVLNRYAGVQSGFQSERISRAIDDEFQNLPSDRDEPFAFAVFFRAKRQYRMMRPATSFSFLYVYQFDGMTDGTPHGWAKWDFGHPGRPQPIMLDELTGLSTLAIHAGAIVTPEPFWTQQQFVLTDDAMLLLSSNHILLMDIVSPLEMSDPTSLASGNLMCDYGSAPYPFVYQTTLLYPAGLAGVARGRWVDVGIIDLAFPIYEPGNTAIQVRTGINSNPNYGLLSMPSYDGLVTQFPRNADGNIEAFQRFMTLKLGRSHIIRIQDLSRDSLFGVSHLSYAFQRLPDEAALETFSETL